MNRYLGSETQWPAHEALGPEKQIVAAMAFATASDKSRPETQNARARFRPGATLHVNFFIS
jgi:hypothetical protein